MISQNLSLLSSPLKSSSRLTTRLKTFCNDSKYFQCAPSNVKRTFAESFKLTRTRTESLLMLLGSKLFSWPKSRNYEGAHRSYSKMDYLRTQIVVRNYDITDHKKRREIQTHLSTVSSEIGLLDPVNNRK